ncbi:hypothetical protein E9993_09865 [Labilibacter sediminis]|nr:hypothetical protein E9993_09865 [Labilibacter sediminis]
MRILILIGIFAVLVSCGSKKKQAELLEQTKPHWLKERPINGGYYYGIGITPKIGSPMLYEDKAKERALADISSQINSTIEAEAILYQVEDKNGVMDYLQNRIKSTSAGYLEGYEYIDKWEDLSNVYVFYQLSKQKYREIMTRRKNEAMQSAKEKYLAGLGFLRAKSHVNAIEHFAMCIDVLSGYLNESTSTLIEGQNVDLVAESKGEITRLIGDLSLVQADLNVATSGFIVYSTDDANVGNMPVRFKFAGGYLTNDLAKTDERGFVIFPELPKSENNEKHYLKVEIDLINLARQVTKNLYVRKVIEHQKAAEISVQTK